MIKKRRKRERKEKGKRKEREREGKKTSLESKQRQSFKLTPRCHFPTILVWYCNGDCLSAVAIVISDLGSPDGVPGELIARNIPDDFICG